MSEVRLREVIFVKVPSSSDDALKEALRRVMGKRFEYTFTLPNGVTVATYLVTATPDLPKGARAFRTFIHKMHNHLIDGPNLVEEDKNSGYIMMDTWHEDSRTSRIVISCVYSREGKQSPKTDTPALIIEKIKNAIETEIEHWAFSLADIRKLYTNDM
jgi:hypothetical protein